MRQIGNETWQSWTRVRAVALIAMTVALLGACSDGAGGKTASKSAQTSAAPSTTNAATAVAALGGDPCALSEQDVAAIVKHGVTEKTKDPNGKTCTYTLGDGEGGTFVGNVVIRVGPSGGPEAETCFRNKACPAAPSGFSELYKSAEPVPGFDHAYLIKSVGQLWVFRGDVLWAVIAQLSGGDEAATTQATIDIARKASA